MNALFIGDVQIFHLKHHITGLRRGLVHPQQHLAAHHQFGQFLGAGFGGRYRGRHLAPPHHADSIGDFHDLAQLVGDQDDGFAFVAQVIQNAEQMVRFGRGQNAGGFVQDQNVGLPVQRLQDFNALLHPHANIFDHGIGVDVQFVFFGQPFQFLARPR